MQDPPDHQVIQLVVTGLMARRKSERFTMIERPPYLTEQVGKLTHIFQQFNRLSREGVNTPRVYHQTESGVVEVNPVFVHGMTKAAESIKADLRQAGKEQLFYETYRKERGARP